MNLTPQEDKEFAKVLVKDIPFFHKLYAKYHDPIYLQIAEDLAKKLASLKEESLTA